MKPVAAVMLADVEMVLFYWCLFSFTVWGLWFALCYIGQWLRRGE